MQARVLVTRKQLVIFWFLISNKNIFTDRSLLVHSQHEGVRLAREAHGLVDHVEHFDQAGNLFVQEGRVLA